jgi:hypothetical protein
MYTLVKNETTNQITSVRIVDGDNVKAIPFDPANTDYAQFKKAISEETAQLQDAEGNLMTAQAAKDLIKELP